jgi:hypothetical protein
MDMNKTILNRVAHDRFGILIINEDAKLATYSHVYILFVLSILSLWAVLAQHVC